MLCYTVFRVEFVSTNVFLPHRALVRQRGKFHKIRVLFYVPVFGQVRFLCVRSGTRCSENN